MSSQLFELVHDERLDQSEVLRFEVPADSPKAYLIAPDYEIAWRDRRFTMGEVEGNRDERSSTISVEAEATWYELGRSTYVGSLVLTEQTPAEGLATILDGTGWSSGDTTSTSSDVFSLEAQDKTRLELLRLWAKVTGRFVVFDPAGRTVALVDERGADLGLGFRYRRNLRRVRKRERPPAITVLYPYGADGLSIAGANGGIPYVEDFTYYTDRGVDLDEIGPDGRTNRERFTRSVTLSDTSFTREADLLAWAQTKIERLSQPVVSYELDVVDLTELTAIAELVRVGDTVRVSDPAFADDVRTTVVRLERYPLDPVRNRVELAYLPELVEDLSSQVGRPSSSQEWIQFLGPVSADFLIRNDGTYTVARIPLRFREGGRANYHLELYATGVGAGTMHVEVYDAEADEVVWVAHEVAYTNGETVRVVASWAADSLEGFRNYRLRVTTTADGGPSASLGVDIAQQPEGGPAGFWILAQGAVQETPTQPNTETFNYTGALQQWTVPENVTGPVTITARGGQGGGSAGGRGGEVVATFPTVTPGTVFDVFVGWGHGSPVNATYPNGGADGGGGSPSSVGYDGGGSSHVIPPGGSFADAWIVAAGGGGASGSENNAGGAGGFFAGGDGESGSAGGGTGATQFAAGTGGAASGGASTPMQTAGANGAANDGGNGGLGGGLLGASGAGAGGGWFGGGGGGGTGNVVGDGAGAGGGGSGWLDLDLAYDVQISDGSHSGPGQVVISWETPA